jgi:hypothetical protein
VEKRAAAHTYTVRSGDTFSGIAREKGIPLTELMKLNPPFQGRHLRLGNRLITDYACLYPGETIRLSPEAAPVAKASPSPGSQRIEISLPSRKGLDRLLHQLLTSPPKATEKTGAAEKKRAAVAEPLDTDAYRRLLGELLYLPFAAYYRKATLSGALFGSWRPAGNPLQPLPGGGEHLLYTAPDEPPHA